MVYPVFDAEHDRCQAALRQYCKSVFPIKHNILSSYLSCFKAIFSNHSLSVSFFYSRMLQKCVQTLAPDVVLVDCSSMAPYALDMQCPKILDFVDIDSHKWHYFSTMTCFPYSLIYQSESKRLSRFEKYLSEKFDRCLLTSSHEKSFLDKQSHITILPNGVDQQYFSTQNTPTDGSLIFTGVMNYFPNTDAVVHFHRHIFPLIRQEVPSTQFIIAGMYPTGEIQQLADRHTLVTGFVPDIRVYLAKAAVCVVPLRIAMGIQNKILEAMAMGVPVVATSAANRSINAAHGQEILVADDPESFAAATLQVLKEHNLRETIRKNAKQFIDQNFRWEKNLQRLDELIAEITRSSTVH